jgi:hypothetical protein
VKQALAVAGDCLALEIVMMAGCELRNGEARIVKINNVAADDVCRVCEHFHSNTHRLAAAFDSAAPGRLTVSSSA